MCRGLFLNLFQKLAEDRSTNKSVRKTRKLNYQKSLRRVRTVKVFFILRICSYVRVNICLDLPRSTFALSTEAEFNNCFIVRVNFFFFLYIYKNLFIRTLRLRLTKILRIC